MAITIIDSGIGSAEASNPGVTIDSRGAQIIIAVGAAEGIAGFTGIVDDNSNTYTAVGTLQQNTLSRMQMWIASNPTNDAALSVNLSMSSGSATNWIAVIAISGLSSTLYYGGNSASASSLAFTPTGAEDAIVAAGLDHSGTGISGLGTGQIEVATLTSGGDELSLSIEIAPGTSANTQSFTNADRIFGVILDASSPTRRVHVT